MMKLISFTGSCGLASHIALEWAGAAYELKLVNRDELKTPEFLAMNPIGKVPVLIEDGWHLSENAAILGYIADSFPQAGLNGDESARARAEVAHWIGFLNSEVHPAFRPLFGATAYLGDEAAVARTKADAKERLGALYGTIDAALAERDWLAGHRSGADAYLFVTLLWTKFVGVNISGFTHVGRFMGRLLADPAVQHAMKAQGLG